MVIGGVPGMAKNMSLCGADSTCEKAMVHVFSTSHGSNAAATYNGNTYCTSQAGDD